MACNVEQQEEEEEDMGYPDMEDVMGEALNMKQKNTLPIYGNKDTMNINPMILSNIQGSAYFKEDLYKMKTFHEVIDEIFYKVSHLILLWLSLSTSSAQCTCRWSTWSRGRRAAESLLDKLECVVG